MTAFGEQKKAYVSCATLICSYIEALGGFLIGSEKDWDHFTIIDRLSIHPRRGLEETTH